MGDNLTIPGGLSLPLPRPEDFRLPTVVPFLPPSPVLPLTPPLVPDRQTVEKALRKGHEVIQGIFDKLSQQPTRYFVEGAAIATAANINPVAGFVVAGTIAAEEGARLVGRILYGK